MTNSSVVDLGHQINRTRTITNHTEYKTDYIILIIDNYTSIMVKYGWRILRPLSKICKSSQKWIRLEIYKKMLLIGIFQTDYGRWASNLPLHIKVLMAAMLVILLTAIASGIYFPTLPLTAETGQPIERTKPTRISWRIPLKNQDRKRDVFKLLSGITYSQDSQ